MSEYINQKIVSLHEEKQKIMSIVSEKQKTQDTESLKERILNWDTLSLNGKKEIAKEFICMVKLIDKDINIYWNE